MELIQIIVIFVFVLYVIISIGDGSFMRFIKRKFKTYKYFIKYSATDPNFKSLTGDILRNSSIHANYNLRETDDQFNADIMLELVERKKLLAYQNKKEYYPGTSKIIRYSLTWQGNMFYDSASPQPYCAIDDENWLKGIPESGLTLQQYREYVIQHEFLHALGYNHVECNAKTAPNGVCPILYQSTRGCPDGFKCGYQITPFDYKERINHSTF